MKYSFHPAAQKELDNSVSYYEECREGLGLEFAREVYSTIQLITEYPNSWQKLSENTRRSLVNRFPFGVIYQLKKDEIVIIAVMHLSRKPGYWKDRG